MLDSLLKISSNYYRNKVSLVLVLADHGLNYVSYGRCYPLEMINFDHSEVCISFIFNYCLAN